MNWNLAAPVMLWGLVGMSIPVIIHLLSRRRATVIDWGAMQFLDIGRRAQRKFQITELLLMAGRMALLALVALAVARPFFTPKAASGGAGVLASLPVEASLGGTPRDVVLVLDGSESMARSAGGTTPRKEAVAWSREFLKRLPSGSSVAILDARDRVRPIVEPPSFDKQALDKALAEAPEPRGSSDLAAAVSEALRVLESTKNTERDVVILTDGQRQAWRPGETARWDL
ncbi:MAG TPA: VWA domain-containing protein, partial [Isosphaeraceae bacterium]|nr:VWA domain-containing protein [Isosphaeraceae bacterium]